MEEQATVPSLSTKSERMTVLGFDIIESPVGEFGTDKKLIFPDGTVVSGGRYIDRIFEAFKNGSDEYKGEDVLLSADGILFLFRYIPSATWSFALLDILYKKYPDKLKEAFEIIENRQRYDVIYELLIKYVNLKNKNEEIGMAGDFNAMYFFSGGYYEILKSSLSEDALNQLVGIFLKYAPKNVDEISNIVDTKEFIPQKVLEAFPEEVEKFGIEREHILEEISKDPVIFIKEYIKNIPCDNGGKKAFAFENVFKYFGALLPKDELLNYINSREDFGTFEKKPWVEYISKYCSS
jgi:hypothetical protein